MRRFYLFIFNHIYLLCFVASSLRTEAQLVLLGATVTTASWLISKDL